MGTWMTSEVGFGVEGNQSKGTPISITMPLFLTISALYAAAVAQSIGDYRVLKLEVL